MRYLDHAATSPMRPEVWDAMAPFGVGTFGNTSGVHGVSRRAKDALEEARERVAALLGARPREIVFTSGGTESDNLAVKGPVFGPSDRRGVVTVATEHEAILETTSFVARLGHPVSVVGVNRDGLVAVDDVVAALDASTAVVSVMAVNNETGVVQDVAAVARAVKEADPDVHVHTDAVQAFGCLDLDVSELGVDLMTITGHKLGGPKGTGVLYVREGTALEPLLHGGGQEMGRRSGTSDVAGAVGLATAMELAVADRSWFRHVIGGTRDDFTKRVVESVEGVEVNGMGAPRSPHHANLLIPGVRNETLLVRLDRAGVAASAGSACQSGAPSVSHVLTAMGRTKEEVRQSLRFSFGWTSTQDEAAEAAALVADLAEELR